MLIAQNCLDDSCLKKGFSLRVAFLPLAPWGHVYERTGGEKVILGGVYSDVVRFVVSGLNCSFDSMIPSDTQWGWKMANGSWNGIFGLLQRNEADVLLGPFMINEQRFLSFGFLEPYFSSFYTILASAGKSGLTSFFSFLLTFDVEIWILLFKSFLALMFLSAVFDVFDSLKNNSKLSLSEAVTHYFWVFLASLFCEGSKSASPASFGRILFGLWLFKILILTNAFSGQFKAALMIQREEGVMYTVKDLADRDDVTPMLLHNTNFEYVFRDSSLDDYRRVFRNALKYKPHSFLKTADFISLETYQKVKDGVGVLVATPLIARSYISKFCDSLTGNRRMYFLDEVFFPQQYAFSVRKDFPQFLRDKLSHRVRQMKESGLLSKWLYEPLRNVWKCEQEDESNENADLNLSHLGSIFVFLGISCFITTVVLVLEVIVKRRNCRLRLSC